MARPKPTTFVTPFSGGKFERFCQSRGRTVEEIAAIAGLTQRTVQRWIRGQSFPVAESWARLATAFGFKDGDELLIAYAELLHAPSTTAPGHVAQQPKIYAADGAIQRHDTVRDALRPLREMLDFDISSIKPKTRQDLLRSSRGTLLSLAALLESEYRNFYLILENR